MCFFNVLKYVTSSFNQVICKFDKLYAVYTGFQWAEETLNAPNNLLVDKLYLYSVISNSATEYHNDVNQ